MKVIRKAKENLFILLIAAAYIAMFIINQNMGIASIKNSFYYIKEMIMIMPVIFVLTALLDLWVPNVSYRITCNNGNQRTLINS